MHNHGLSPVILYAALVGAAAIVGISVAEAPWQISFLASVAALGILGLVLLRAAASQALQAAPAGGQPVQAEDHRLRAARFLYYVGAATIGILTVRPALGFTASDWIFLGALGMTVLVVIVRGYEPYYLIPRAVTVGVLLFALGGLVSSTQALYPYASALVVVRMLYLTLVWFWLGTALLQTRAHVQNALIAWVCSAAFSSAGAVAQFFYGDVISGGTIAYGRMTGFTEHFNILGGLTATAFVPALMLAVDAPQRWVRLVGSAATALIAAGLLLSGSVGGLVAVSVATLVWLALRGVSLRILVSGAVTVAAAFILMSATGSTDAPSPIDRIKRVTAAERAEAGTGGTIYTRFEGYAKAWEQISEQPFVGVGLDETTSFELLDGHAVHNLVLGPWYTAGILGLVGIAMLVAGAVATGIRVLRNSSARERSFTAALVASVAAFIQHGMGEPILFVRYGWFPTALLLVLSAQQIRAGAYSATRVRRPEGTPVYAPTS
jgi:O-antigen ligase